MVRTSGGIRISAGKSSKKGGGAAGSSASSTPSAKIGCKGNSSSRLPPIPHCEAPSWQKPITNFFNTGASSSKDDIQIIDKSEKNLKDTDTEAEYECDKPRSSALANKINNTDVIKETNDSDCIEKEKTDTKKITEDLNNMNEDEPKIKRRKEEQEKENEFNNNI